MQDEVKKWLNEKLLQFGDTIRGYYVTDDNRFIRVEVVVQIDKYGDIEFMKSINKLEEELRKVFSDLIVNFLITYSL